ncbi:hypothetical protein WJ47_33385 [Burkholderia ubonensis]|uniref:Uncharacterized protein n=1 Tax=Burkholderia ubonensis TaxID=101571 RepID=A0AB73FYF7_9BURK|nr:hypothetical protein [Burkholderia ubonensis]KVK71658.1 hypothetical protein WJ44_20465 [Burkholderia ubonensis]KVL76043.1 hypothetical protein WJ47_33385 [Burkholderia ubonensis]KVM28579.1 hypothetical protein WJ53_09435 [Burkholderia ubonensis]KVM30421.1 hypothetical protein WJ54_11245 [Burkholderia ubonensis]
MTNTNQQAIEDAVEQIGKSMLANAVPLFYVAQNVYDTSQSLLDVWNARDATDEMTKVETGIDLLFAIVGWVPVVGAGVKQTFRLVNHKSEIYGPLLFDILRLVLQEAHCPTSPEQLVDKLFDAAGLKNLLTGARGHIEKSWLYRDLPAEGQAAVSAALVYGERNLPFWVTMFVERKLMHWKRKQPNSSAEGEVSHRKETEKPGRKGAEAEEGRNRAKPASSRVVNAKLAVRRVTNKVTGILGEHIADYYCYEKLKWGNGWTKHDDGLAGKWEVAPSARVFGKLNDGAKLNKLFAEKAHGNGIDGVWRATPANNNGKPFAIVEAKSSRVAQKRVRKGKPGVSGLLGHAVDKVLPRPVELLEPPDDEGEAAGNDTSTGKKKGGRRRPPKSGSPAPKAGGRDAGTPPASGTSLPKSGDLAPTGDKIAQMSRGWIRQNLQDAVGPAMARTVEAEGYARHILYVPFYLPSALQHAKALLIGIEHVHPNHNIRFHYREEEVRVAVNEKQQRLNDRYGIRTTT